MSAKSDPNPESDPIHPASPRKFDAAVAGVIAFAAVVDVLGEPPAVEPMVAWRLTPERWRTCLHEAAHAVIALDLGADLDLVSVRRGKACAGITIPFALPGWSGDVAGVVTMPLPLVPADLRRAVEVRVCIYLAGEVGELLALDAAYRPDRACVQAARRLARSLTDLSPRHIELLKAAECADEHEPDYVLARNAARALGTPTEAEALVLMCRTVTTELVGFAAGDIRAVAQALRTNRVLTGDEVLAIRAERRGAAV